MLDVPRAAGLTCWSAVPVGSTEPQAALPGPPSLSPRDAAPRGRSRFSFQHTRFSQHPALPQNIILLPLQVFDTSEYCGRSLDNLIVLPKTIQVGKKQHSLCQAKQDLWPQYRPCLLLFVFSLYGMTWCTSRSYKNLPQKSTDVCTVPIHFDAWIKGWIHVG